MIHHPPNTWNGSNNKYKMPPEAVLIAMDRTGRDEDGLNPTEVSGVFFDGSNVPIAVGEATLLSNIDGLRYPGSTCKGMAGYDPKLSALENEDTAPWFFCDPYTGCDFKITIEQDTTLYGYDIFLPNGDLTPKTLFGHVVEFFAAYSDPSPEEWGYDAMYLQLADTATSVPFPYMEVTVGDESCLLTWDQDTTSYLLEDYPSGAHPEVLPIVNYFKDNVGSTACVKLVGKFDQVETLTYDGVNMTYDGEDITTTIKPNT